MGDTLTFLLVAAGALVVGAGLATWIAHLRHGTATAAVRSQFDRELATTAERARALEQSVAELKASLEETVASKSRVETDLAAERASSAVKIKALTEAHERLTAEFKAISADVLKSSNAAFLELARETFGKLHQQSSGELEKRQQAIDAVIKPLKESLEKVDTRIAEIEAARARAYGQLGQQLEQLSSAQLRLQAEAARLSTALRSTSYAGSWGELQLRRVVEMADMLPYVDFVEQESSGALRADMIIRLPGGQNIVVDAKSPVQSYRDAVEATDETARVPLLAQHAQKIRGHIDALSAKSYWEQFQPAPEFVVLFVPGDHFLSAALQTDASLLERAISRRVLLATPTTLIALLKAAAYGWRQESVSKNAEEISALGRQLYDRVATFAEHLEKIGRGLENAMKGYNAAIGSFEQSVLPGARRFAELGAKGAKDIQLPGAVETPPREITRRE